MQDPAFRVERITWPARSVVLRVGLPRDLEPGDLHDTLELRLADSEFMMCVPLHVMVMDAIAVVPATIFFCADRRGIRPVMLLVTAGKEPLGTVSLADAPAGLHVGDMGELTTGRLRTSSWRERTNWDCSVIARVTCIGGKC